MKKTFFASLTNSQKVMLIVALVGGTCAVIACVGLGTPIVSKLLDLFYPANASRIYSDSYNLYYTYA